MAKTAAAKPPSEHEELVKQLVALLDGGQAHATFADAVKDLPASLRGAVPKGAAHSAWQVVEHIRIAQRDILDFSAPPTGGYQPMEWPKDYWPESTEPGPGDWDRSIAAVEADLKAFKKLITKSEADLVKPFRWGTGQNLMRESLLIADHNAYHVGELVLLRRLLGAWKES